MVINNTSTALISTHAVSPLLNTGGGTVATATAVSAAGSTSAATAESTAVIVTKAERSRGHQVMRSSPKT